MELARENENLRRMVVGMARIVARIHFAGTQPSVVCADGGDGVREKTGRGGVARKKPLTWQWSA